MNSFVSIPPEIVYKHILLCLSVKEFLKIRLLSTDLFQFITKASLAFPPITEEEEVAPRATMINMSVCMVCEKRGGAMDQKMIPYDQYPRRLYVYCNTNMQCFSRMIASIIQLSKEEQRTLLYDRSHTPYHFLCPRSNGSFTPATCQKYWCHPDNKIRGEWHVFFEDSEGACYYQKDVLLSPVPSFTKKRLSFY